jgi:26S proteasome regulatory subunit N7
MAPFYELICEEQGWPVDTTLLNNMKKENEEALKKLDDRLKDAEENLGETEISDTLLARAEHFAKIGDKVLLFISLFHYYRARMRMKTN